MLRVCGPAPRPVLIQQVADGTQQRTRVWAARRPCYLLAPGMLWAVAKLPSRPRKRGVGATQRRPCPLPQLPTAEAGTRGAGFPPGSPRAEATLLPAGSPPWVMELGLPPPSPVSMGTALSSQGPRLTAPCRAIHSVAFVGRLQRVLQPRAGEDVAARGPGCPGTSLFQVSSWGPKHTHPSGCTCTG